MPDKILGKPSSHSDVLNKHLKTLLIGYGWVGQQCHKYFPESHWYTPNEGLHTPADAYIGSQSFLDFEVDPQYYEVAFISVPSPMKADGSCDVSYVDDVVRQWHRFVKLFIVRSTVTPGTIDKLQKQYPENLFVMQPEYVGETLAHPHLDVNRSTFIILGGTPEATELAAHAWSLVLHANSHIRQITGLAGELCKYMENAFLGTKVIFVNEFRQLAESMGVDYNQLREAWLDDDRVGRSHSFAYKANPGFSGKCLPKDINSIVNYARTTAKQPLKLMEAVLNINAEMREDVPTTEKLMPEDPAFPHDSRKSPPLPSSKI